MKKHSPGLPLNSYRQSLYGAIIRIGANLVMLAAIFPAMYYASRWHYLPAEATFCLIFFGITVPTWILAWFLAKKVRRIFPAECQSMVDLPGRGSQLVSWRVQEAGCDLLRCRR